MHNAPSHVAIIMDGNRRWALRSSDAGGYGHECGVKAARHIITCACDNDISFLTLFALSAENILRNDGEIDALMKILFSGLLNHKDEMMQKNIRMMFIGDSSLFPDDLQTLMHKAQDGTMNNGGMRLIIALNYGGKQDILNAAQKIAQDVLSKKICVDDVDKDSFDERLMTDGIPDPDLLIRTGGEKRISNFMLWQISYTELYFSDKLWPDFTTEDFEIALQDYAKRDRRYGRN